MTATWDKPQFESGASILEVDAEWLHKDKSGHRVVL